MPLIAFTDKSRINNLAFTSIVAVVTVIQEIERVDAEMRSKEFSAARHQMHFIVDDIASFLTVIMSSNAQHIYIFHFSLKWSDEIMHRPSLYY